MQHITQQVDAIESAISQNPNLAFELAKTLIESTCKTILRELGTPAGSSEDLPALFRRVRQSAPLLPPNANNEALARESLSATLNGLSNAVQGVCELRNAYPFASHGTDGAVLSMESAQAILAAQAADSIVGFLWRLHRQHTDYRRPLTYEDNLRFNEVVDDLYGPMKIFDLEYRPSEVLFQLDHQAYEDALAAYATGDDASSEAELRGGAC